MTKAHQALTLLQIARAAPALLTSYSSLGARLLFFQPDAHGFSRDTEDALKPSQRTALLISIEDLFFFGIGITFRLWIVTTTTIAVVTPVALFAIRSTPIAYNVFASTVTTFKGDSDHRFRLSTIPLYFSTTRAQMIATTFAQLLWRDVWVTLRDWKTFFAMTFRRTAAR